MKSTQNFNEHTKLKRKKKMKKGNFTSLDDVNDDSDEFNSHLYLENSRINLNKNNNKRLRYGLSAAFTITITIILAITLSLLLSPSNNYADAVTNSSNGITVHILDTTKGLPAQNVNIKLEFYDTDTSSWIYVSSSKTNSNGRIDPFWPLDSSSELEVGLYQMTFQTKEYFDKDNITTFYPYVNVVFNVTDPVAHYHIPLLLTPYSYTTYRGS